MKVLFHIPYPVIGGAELQIKYLLKYLPADLVPLITYEFPEVEPFVKSLNIEYERVFSPITLIKAIDRFNPDIIQYYHSHTMYAAIKRSKVKSKVVEIVHNRIGFPGDSASYPKERTTVVVGVSDDASDYFMAKLPDVYTVTIPNGIDTETFTPRGGKKPKRARPLGGFTGRLEGGLGKGIGRIIEAVRELPCDFELCGKDYGDWHRYIDNEGITNIKVIPHTDDPVECYRRWDFFVSGSPSEGFGLSIAEAISCGLPSVIWDCGGVTRYLEHGKHCLIANDAESFKESIKQVMTGKLKLQPTTADLSAKTMAQKYYKLYESILESNQSLSEQSVIKMPLPRENKHLQLISPTVTGDEKIVLGVCPDTWLGVRRALSGFCTHIVSPYRAATIISDHNPAVVVFGCYNPEWEKALLAAKKNRSKTVLTWHASYILNEFDHINREWMWHAHAAAKQGLFDYVATPHEGLAKAWTALGIKTDFLPNIITTELAVQPKLPGINIGILGSGMPWKNMDCQVVAAGLFAQKHPSTKIHIQKMSNKQSAETFGIKLTQHAASMSDAEYYAFVGGMTMNMVVSTSETYSYFTAESLILGAPILTGSITPVLHRAPDELVKHCVTSAFDDPYEIAEKLEQIYKAKGLVELGRKHMLLLNEENKKIVERVRSEWIK